MQPHDVPAASISHVFIDFDGTITRRDVLDDLIQRYARDESWKLTEILWQAGKIGSKECLANEFALLNVASTELTAFLEQVEIDPGLHDLLRVCRQYDVPVAILSDGIDFFIRQILQRYGLESVPVRANGLLQLNSRWTLVCPWSDRACLTAAAHCKCASIKALREHEEQTIYIGDGRSDLCPARSAQMVFAKAALARHLTAEGTAFVAYHTLLDVACMLERAWSAAEATSDISARKVAS